MSLPRYINLVSLLAAVSAMVSLLVGIFDSPEAGFGTLLLIGGVSLMMLFFVGAQNFPFRTSE